MTLVLSRGRFSTERSLPYASPVKLSLLLSRAGRWSQKQFSPVHKASVRRTVGTYPAQQKGVRGVQGSRQQQCQAVLKATVCESQSS